MKLVFLATGLFTVVGLWLMARGARDVWRACRSVHWTPVSATILKAKEVYDDEGSSKPEVAYRYAVAGINHEANHVYFGQGISSPGGHTSRILGKYREGAVVEAYYDPRRPSLAVLEPGYRKSALTFVAFGWLFVAIGTGFLFLWWTTTP